MKVCDRCKSLKPKCITSFAETPNGPGDIFWHDFDLCEQCCEWVKEAIRTVILEGETW